MSESGGSLAALLFESDRPGDEALVHVGELSWTRSEVAARAETVAAALRGAGVAPGQAVGVQLPNGVDLIAVLFGVWRAGAVYVPLNPRLSARELDHVLATVPPAAVVRPPTGSAAGDGEGWQVEPGAGDPVTYGGDVCLVQFTSGTTGRPKAVLLEHHGVRTLLEGVLAKLRGGGPPDPTKTPMPNLVPVSLSLWAGIYNVLFAFLAGAPVVVLPAFTTAGFVDAVRRHGIRSTVLPPAAMAMLADDESVEDLAPLRFVRSITAPLSPLGARRFRDRFGISVLNSYGQTEIGGEIVGWSAADSREFGEAKLGSVGRPHRGVELRTAADGELLVRTPAMSAGYADGADLSDRMTADGWFRTGDHATVDDDGFVWIEGRVSDMVNRGGLKVFPGEVEEVLRLHPAVADAAVVGVADDRLGEVPWAFVVLGAGTDADGSAGALEAHCRALLAPYKVPVGFAVLDALPRNEVGKVLKGELAGSVTR